ncbi:MAG: PF20097 family protein [Bacteroidales bacterium]
MNFTCPYCNNTLTPGKVKMEDSMWGFFLLGLSYMNLNFISNSNRETRVMKSFSTLPAFLCENCETVIINPKNSNGST